MLWGDKPFHSLNYYLQNKFGTKVYKVSLNAGFTCPNRDGTLGTGGCIFCSSEGSGDFTPAPTLSITQQLQAGKTLLKKKCNAAKFIAYFQAFTNTYGPVPVLEKIYREALEEPSVVGLAIATRPDCINEDILSLISSLNEYKPIWVELGLQTIHPETALFIRRGYDLQCFESAVTLLNEYHIDPVVHIILGLPWETKEMMLETISYLSAQKIQGVKLQLLHILKNTDLAVFFEKNPFPLLSQEEYIQLIVDCIERMPKQTVIHRITGDAPRKLLVAPKWSTNKKVVLNEIHHEFKKRNTWQGKFL